MKGFYFFSGTVVLYLLLLFAGCCSNYCAGRGVGDYIYLEIRDASTGASLMDSLGLTVSDLTLKSGYQVWKIDSTFQIETPNAISRDNLKDQLMVSIRNREETIAIQFTGSGDEPCCQHVSPTIVFIEPLGNAQVRNEGGEWRLTIFW